MMLLAMGVWAVPFLAGPFDETVSQAIGALSTVVLLTLLSFVFIIRDFRKLFNGVTVLVGLRFLLAYFQVFEDLATTGVGLMVSGVMIIGIAVLWFKKREAYERWMETWVA